MALMLSEKTLPDLSLLEPLDCTNYKRWSQQLLIFFEQIEVDYVLFNETPTIPSLGNGDTTEDMIKVAQTFAKHNKLVRAHLLNNMSNNLFDQFVSNKSAKSIWEMLKKKYGADDARNRKYATEKWLSFQMVDDKSIMEQVHEYQNLVEDVLNEGMKMCEVLQGKVLLEKFPPSWSEFRNHLEHENKDFTLQELISYVRDEEANRQKDRYHFVPKKTSNADIVESSSIMEKYQNNTGKKSLQKKWLDNKLNKPNSIVQKNKGASYVWGKLGIAVPLAITLTIIILFGSGHHYHHLAKPFWFAPLWFIHLATLGSSFLMGLAAVLVRADGGFRGESDALYLYEAHVCLSIVWHPLVLVMSAYWVALVSCVVNFGTLFLCYLRFRKVNPFAKDLAKVCLVWAAYLTLVSFKLMFL